jgi:hypothetical protein
LPPVIRLCLSLLLAVAGLVAVPGAASAAPPVNDAYLQSIPVNQRGTPLTEEQVKDARDTREATVQTDLFAPPASGGGPERTDCRATHYGATVWYDFHPQSDGVVRVQAAGYDAAVSIYEFDPATAKIGARLDCSNETGTTEELFVDVTKGKSYTIQIGGNDAGLGPATGDLDFTFEYLSDRDGDGTLDALDKCPDQPGTSDGCPEKLTALPRLRAIPTAGGVKVSSLTVQTPKGARVRVRCTHGCKFTQSRTAVKAGTLAFPRLANRQLPAGSRLEIFVTKKQSIGAYFRYSVTRGSFKSIVRCLAPASLSPRTSCK